MPGSGVEPERSSAATRKGGGSSSSSPTSTTTTTLLHHIKWPLIRDPPGVGSDYPLLPARVIVTVLSTMATRYLHVHNLHSPVLASSSMALLVSTYLDRRLGQAALCGSIAGMSGGHLTPNLSLAAALGMLTSICYEMLIHIKNLCSGIGGRLGVAAFLATSVVAKHNGVSIVARRVRRGALLRKGGRVPPCRPDTRVHDCISRARCDCHDITASVERRFRCRRSCPCLFGRRPRGFAIPEGSHGRVGSAWWILRGHEPALAIDAWQFITRPTIANAIVFVWVIRGGRGNGGCAPRIDDPPRVLEWRMGRQGRTVHIRGMLGVLWIGKRRRLH